MLHIETLTLGEFQTNTYLVWSGDSPTCAVIDPGYEPETILARVRSLGLTVGAVLLTHGHFDHVGGVRAIAEATHCPVWMCEGDWSQLDTPENRFFYPLANCADFEISFIEAGEEITAGGATFEALLTPGHTHGSVCLRCGDVLFSGDTLFAGSCGRTDLPGGSPAHLRRSLGYLSEIPVNLTVYPGHGPATTLDRERQTNPYF